MSIYIVHPGSGTYIDLSECVVVSDAEVAESIGLSTEVEPLKRNEVPKHSTRVYLFAVREGGDTGQGGTEREIVVLDSLDNERHRALEVSGEAVEYYDGVSDLFMDIF